MSYTAASSTPRIAAVIVNWNRSDDLGRLLADLHSQTESFDEILVIDNGSSDGSPDMVEREYPGVQLKRLAENVGFVVARNLAVDLVQSDSIVFLDNDIRIPDPLFASKARDSIRSHPQAGIISFWLFEKQPVNSVPTPPQTILSFHELSECAKTGKAPIQLLPFYGRFFSGGACIMRREVSLRIGPLCTEFPYGFEETDFAYRCQAAGVGLLIDPGLWAIHLRSGEMRVNQAPFVNLRNVLIAHARYMPRFDFCLFLLASLCSHAVLAIMSHRIGDFARMWLEFTRSWRSKISGRRQPVSRQTMRRWYYLAVHRPVDFTRIDDAGTTALRFYTSHLWRRIFNSSAPGFGLLSTVQRGALHSRLLLEEEPIVRSLMKSENE